MKPKLIDRESLAAGLIALGLTAEEKPIDGYAFTLSTEPRAAVESYQKHHSARRPTRFYIDTTMFILAE